MLYSILLFVISLFSPIMESADLPNLTVSAGLQVPSDPGIIHGPIEIPPVYIVAPKREVPKKAKSPPPAPAFSGEVYYRTHWDGSTIVVLIHPSQCIGDCGESR